MTPFTLSRPPQLHVAIACQPASRCIAIGDVHGNLTQFAQALQVADAALREGDCDHVVLLGNLIDFGPDSVGCLRLAAQFRAKFEGQVDVLAGNHEQMMLTAIYDEDPRARRVAYYNWRRQGGDVAFPDEIALEHRREILEELGFGPDGWDSHVRDGNVLFVHAGVPPGMDPELLEQFLAKPLLGLPHGIGHSLPHWAWIRSPFLESEEPYDGHFVVHGHSPWDYTGEPRAGRLNLDGGAKQQARVCLASLLPGMVEISAFAPLFPEHLE